MTAINDMQKRQSAPWYLIVRRKFRSLLNNPRRLNANYVVPKLSGQQLSTLANLKVIPTFGTASSLMSGQRWEELANYIDAHEHPLMRVVAGYLRSNDAVSGSKAKTTQRLIHAIEKAPFIDKMSMPELLSASNVLTQFGFFKVSAVFQYAAIAKELGKEKSNGVNRRAAKITLRAADWDDLENLLAEVKAPYHEILKAEKKAIQQQGLKLLEALKTNSVIDAQRKKESLPADAYQSTISLRNREMNLAGSNILLAGPSVRKSQSVSFDWPDKVLRIGFRGADSVASDHEMPTNISFYKDHKLSDLTEEEINLLAAELDCFVVSGLKTETVRAVRSLPNVFYSRFSGRILFNAECNAGLEALLCIIDAGAQKVHIKNVDLLISNVYPHGYKSNNYEKRTSVVGWGLDEEIVCRSMALGHSPLAQYSLFKYFWNENRLSGDHFFQQLMNEGLLAYLERLESTYHPFRQ